MLEFAGLNYWAIIVVWLLYMTVGAYWYSTAGFAKHWTKYTGIDILKIPPAKATKILISVAISCLLQVFALALILHSLKEPSATSALLVAIILWLGFTTATTVGVTLYSQRSWKFLWLNSSYFLVVMIFGAIILTQWR